MSNHKYAAWRCEGSKVPVQEKEKKEKQEKAGRNKIKIAKVTEDCEKGERARTATSES